MAQIVTLEIPDEVVRRAREIAASTQRRLEDVLVEWMNHASAAPPVETLSDEQIVELCNLQIDDAQQDEMDALLTRQREGALNRKEQARLDELLSLYRRGTVRKAQAIRVAVERGLRPPLG
ncbi:MAG: hypothetical protein K8I60_05615 [Anaerolineae bacterium]|nr:hypothetical protein [Anaerolineae bacterium]